jgi:hypothetical protein
VREIRSPGSVRGAARKGRPYRDWGPRAGSLRSCDTMSQLELSSSAGKEDTRSSMEDHPFHRVSLPA